jgi:branched-chain amino acid transport system permease protein
VFAAFFRATTLGVAMRAVADDQQAAQSLGVSVPRILAASWAIAAMVAAVAGVVVGSLNGLNADALSFIGLKVFPAVILGGLDSVPGAVVGGVTIGVLENMTGGYLDPLVGGGTKEVAPFVVLVLVLMLKPYGLFGTVEIERV